jgi:hypothetical protein
MQNELKTLQTCVTLKVLDNLHPLLSFYDLKILILGSHLRFNVILRGVKSDFKKDMSIQHIVEDVWAHQENKQKSM